MREVRKEVARHQALSDESLRLLELLQIRCPTSKHEMAQGVFEESTGEDEMWCW